MDYNQITMLSNTLKGAPLSCLFVLLLLKRPAGVIELSALTGYSRDTIKDGLRKLKSLDLATTTSRYHGWQLTTSGYQLPLVNSENAGSLMREAEKNGLPPRSSSSIDPYNSLDTKQPLLQQTRPKKTDSRLEDLLITRCGCPRRIASKAISTAISEGESSNWVEYDILTWLAYTISPAGKGIRNRGVFIASKIQNGEPCPDYFKPEPGSELALEIDNIYRQLEELPHD